MNMFDNKKIDIVGNIVLHMGIWYLVGRLFFEAFLR